MFTKDIRGHYRMFQKDNSKPYRMRKKDNDTYAYSGLIIKYADQLFTVSLFNVNMSFLGISLIL